MTSRLQSLNLSPCPPLTDAEWPDYIADLKDGFAGRLNVYRVMAHHPALLRAWTQLRQHLVLDTALGPERSEVVILRAAHRLGSRYEWVHHTERALKIGFSTTRIESIRGTAIGEDALIVRAVDAVFDDHRLPAALERELAQSIGRAGVFDLIATVGFYSILGTLLLTYETPLEPELALKHPE